MYMEHVKYFLLVLPLAACCSNSISNSNTLRNASSCCEKNTPASLLESAVDIINKAKSYLTCDDDGKEERVVDCADILKMGTKENGVYEVSPMNRLTEDQILNVYCDMETDGGGWTLIQRRGDFGNPRNYFFKDWKSYKEGFGDVAKDFWLGNDNIFALTNQKLYSARFDLKDVEGNSRYALYGTFWIDDENQQYKLHISDFSGDAGDSMISTHNNQKFTTLDDDNDLSNDNCAIMYKGAWWYNNCHDSNLNGMYYNGKQSTFGDGVNWFTWKKLYESLHATEIKIRPKNFTPL